MAGLIGKGFQFEQFGSPTGMVFESGITKHKTLTTMRLHFAHEFNGVGDIGDRLKSHWRHDFIAWYMSHAGNPVSRLRGAVKGHELHSITKSPVSDRINRRLSIIVSGEYFEVDSHASGQGITPAVRELHFDSAPSPHFPTIPIRPDPVVFLAGKPAVDLLTGIHHAVHHHCLIHRVTPFGCLSDIRLQVTGKVNRYLRLFEGVWLGIRYRGSWPRYPYEGGVILSDSLEQRFLKDTTTF